MSGKKEGKPLHIDDVLSIYNHLMSFTYEERIKLLELNPDRADVIIPACEIFMSVMKTADIKKIIFRTGFYKAKAKNIVGLSRLLVEKFGGVVPTEIEDLIQLPGVGRKTAQVTRAYAFNLCDGIPVDTHVKRFAIRYNLTDNTVVEKIEQDLCEVIPRDLWIEVPSKFIAYGRRLAPAKKYDTSIDPLVKVYLPAGNIFRVN